MKANYLLLMTIFAGVNACGPVAKHSSSANSRSAGKAAVRIDASALGLSSDKALSVHIIEAKSKVELKKEYAGDQQDIREQVAPGQYQYRVVALDQGGKVTFDSELCYRQALPKEQMVSELPEGSISSQVLELAANKEEVIALQACELSAETLASDPYAKELASLHKATPEGVVAPGLPRRSLTVGEALGNTTTVTASLGVSFWGVAKASTKVATSLNVQFKSDISINKHAPTPDTALLIDGTDELAYEEGVAFVGQCNYYASVTGAVEGGVTLGVSGNIGFATGSADISNTTRLERASSVQASSSLFAIRPKDTVGALKDRCKELFTKEVEDQVNRDLLNLVTSSLIRNNRDGGESVLQAALKGPDAKGVDANGKRWNAYKAEIMQEGSKVTVAGKLDHAVDYWFDDSICYRVAVDKDANGQPAILNAEYNNCDGGGVSGGWVDAGKQISETIGIEAWKMKNPQ